MPTDNFKVGEYTKIHRGKLVTFIVYSLLIAGFIFLSIMHRKNNELKLSGKVYQVLQLFIVVICLILVGLGVEFYDPDGRHFYYGSKKYDGGFIPTYNYGTNGTSFYIIQSPGLDSKRDLLDLEEFINSNYENSEYLEKIKLYSYDSTNGTISSGDVFRMKD